MLQSGCACKVGSNDVLCDVPALKFLPNMLDLDPTKDGCLTTRNF